MIRDRIANRLDTENSESHMGREWAKVSHFMENINLAVTRELRDGLGFGSSEFHFLPPRDAMGQQYVHCLVSNKSFRKEAASHMSGTAVLRRVPTSFLDAAEVLVPSLNLQRSIVAEVDRHLSFIRKVEAKVDTNLQRARGLRQSTLFKLFQ